jgi:hypothetical protein
LVHLAGQATNGFCVVDIWESEEAVRRFRETISPIAQAVGIEEHRSSSRHTPLFRLDLPAQPATALREGS